MPPKSDLRLTASMCVAELLTMLGAFAFPALLPRFVSQWGISNTEAGWINGVYFAGYAAAVPLLAGLTDRIDGRRIYLAGALVGSLAAAGFAVFAQGFWSALTFRLLAGLGLAGTFIPGLKALVDRLEPGAQPRGIAFYTAVFGLGTSLSFYIAGELGRVAGWRWAFVAAAAGAFLAMALAAWALRPLPPRPRQASRPLDFRPVLRDRQTVGFILAYSLHTWELFSFRSWAVAFLAFSATLDPSGHGPWSPAVVAALAGLLATGANMAGSEIALRRGRAGVISAIMLGSVLLGACLGFLAALPYRWVAVLTVLYALFIQGDSAALHTGAVGSADPEHRGRAMALQSLVGFGTASLGPLAVGVALDATGGGAAPVSWGAAFLTMSAVTLLGPVVLNRCSKARQNPAKDSRDIASA